MIEVSYIIGLSMAIVNILKKRLSIPKDVVPILAVLLAILFHIINALLFGGEVTLAIKESFVSAGIVVGLFATTDAKTSITTKK